MRTSTDKGDDTLSRIRVAFNAITDAPFIERDRQALREAFAVVDVRMRSAWSLPRLGWTVLRSDLVFSWFAQDHAYAACRFARLFNRRSVVVVGGVDAAKIPELGYGEHTLPGAARSRYALAHSDRVLVVDDFLRDEIARNAGVRRPEIVTVPLGFDTDLFRPGDEPRTTVLTVGIVNRVNIRRKGLETFVQAARFLPDLPFVLVGARDSEATAALRKQAPPNVRFLPFLQAEDLIREYRMARVYVQVSMYEGLPSALGEAMACGCVPVGTRAGGIPTLIGDTGAYVSVGDAEGTAAAIRAAFTARDGSVARARIVREFPAERRRAALHALVRELVEDQPDAR